MERPPVLQFRRREIGIALMVCERLSTIGFKPKMGLTQRTVLNMRTLESAQDDVLAEFAALQLDQAKRDADGKPMTQHVAATKDTPAHMEYVWDDPFAANREQREFWKALIDVPGALPYTLEDLNALLKVPDDITAIMRGLGPLCPSDQLTEEATRGLTAAKIEG